MSYRLMFMINAIVCAVFGAVFLVAPKSILFFFDMTDAIVATQPIARFFGGALIVTAALLWFLQEGGKELQKTHAITMMVASIGGFILTIMGMFSDKVIRANGWIPLVVYFLFAVGYAYLVFGVKVTVKKKK